MNSLSELPEFLATVSSASNPQAALQAGIAGIAEMLEADFAAVVREDVVLAFVGLAEGAVPDEQLLAAACGPAASTIELPSLGRASMSVVHLDDDGCDAIIARCGSALDADEIAHAQAMARILALAVQLLNQIAENEQLLQEHQEHERMLEAILRIQRLISQRSHIDSILEAITNEAALLLSADLTGICLSSPSGAGRTAMASGNDDTVETVMSIVEGDLVEIGKRAASGELKVARPFSLDCGSGETIEARVVGSPVFDDGTPIGGFYVLSIGPFNPTTEIDTAAVETFASQASIALTDAATLDELHHAFRDTLTGLPNRALFHDRFEHAVAIGERRKTSTALLFIDLDRFKAVNDTMGHAAGDELLREVARSLTEAGRSHDSVARLGGDEFAMLLEDTSEEGAELVARRLLARIGRVKNGASPGGRCSASIGIALSGPNCRTTDDLLRQADIAMYAAKARGRSDVAIYRSEMGTSRLDQKAMVEAMSDALERDHFVVHYQPIVSLQTRQIVGAEALVRWHDPERGMLSPADFIATAEDTGMIVPIGRRVLNVACQQAAAWRRTVPSAGDFKLSVNLSGRQLQDEGIRDDVDAALTRSGLDPSALTLEITESTFVDDADAAGVRLRMLKGLGVRLAIDDFGTGFSSLSYVHHFPFDVMKIDRTFVSGLGSSTNGRALVKTLVALAQQLSMATVAEGIESPGELAQLRALRCSHGQGFLFSRPVDADSFEILFNERDRLHSVP